MEGEGEGEGEGESEGEGTKERRVGGESRLGAALVDTPLPVGRVAAAAREALGLELEFDQDDWRDLLFEGGEGEGEEKETEKEKEMEKADIPLTADTLASVALKRWEVALCALRRRRALEAVLGIAASKAESMAAGAASYAEARGREVGISLSLSSARVGRGVAAGAEFPTAEKANEKVNEKIAGAMGAAAASAASARARATSAATAAAAAAAVRADTLVGTEVRTAAQAAALEQWRRADLLQLVRLVSAAVGLSSGYKGGFAGYTGAAPLAVSSTSSSSSSAVVAAGGESSSNSSNSSSNRPREQTEEEEAAEDGDPPLLPGIMRRQARDELVRVLSDHALSAAFDVLPAVEFPGMGGVSDDGGTAFCM